MESSSQSTPPAAAPAGSANAADEAGQEAFADAFAERPEVYVGAAFAGGLLLATVIRVFGK